MPPLPLFIVDAFAERPFTGNPAAVCVLEREGDLTDERMQQIAAEMNLSETAFVAPSGSGVEDEFPARAERTAPGAHTAGQAPAAHRAAALPISIWSLRWFTPAAEVELCGHATLASAHTLWSTGGAPVDQPLTFRTRFSGDLVCTRRHDQSGDIAEEVRRSSPDPAAESDEVTAPFDLVEMDFPASHAAPADPPPRLIELLGVEPVGIYRARYDWLVELDSVDAVRSAAPDFAGLRTIDTRGVIITAAADPERDGCDFVSRFFAPRLRVDEDPVTGSAHCVLAPFWSKRLGRRDLVGRQVSARGGVVLVTDRGERITLAGRAVTVLAGSIVV